MGAKEQQEKKQNKTQINLHAHTVTHILQLSVPVSMYNDNCFSVSQLLPLRTTDLVQSLVTTDIWQMKFQDEVPKKL